MAAYAALVSLINNIDQTTNHPRVSTFFHKKQLESLLQRVDFLLLFLESYNSYEAEDLERQIASAAHSAEDVIESHIVDQILHLSPDKGPSFLVKVMEEMRLRKPIQRLKLDLRKIMEDMDSIKKKVIKVKEEKRCKSELPYSSTSAASSTPRKTNMVGFGDYLIQLLEELTGDQSDQKIIPIVGMGGIGKTTLAKNAYDNLLVVHHFDVRAWVTISEGYNVRVILFEILSCLSQSHNRMDAKTEHELGEQLHKTLSGMRYLIVLDDIWGTEVWDEIKFFFPNNCNRSRIIVTTRILDVANHFGSTRLALDFLDDDQSWKLFCEKVFSEEACPPELKESGMKIVKKCKGLPLSIVVIGGLLRNSPRTQDQWENVERDMRSILNTAEDSRCLKLLSLSYSHLPACLKPCFLYLAIFSEDDVISVSRLIKLWVAEGFIKPNKDQSLEEIAEGYIKNLVGRNLIYVHSLRCNGRFKTCCMHDLLRDLCIRVARKEEFFCATSVLDAPQELRRWRRHIIVPARTTWKMYVYQKSLARSLICKGRKPWGKHRLLRVLIAKSYHNIWSHVNLRFFALESMEFTFIIPSSISLLWNVQTLIVTGGMLRVYAHSEIWKMPQLRHLMFSSITLPYPSPTDGSVLHNLQTLGNLLNFSFTEDVCERIPNITKLRVSYGHHSKKSVRWTDYCLHNLILLNKLESLNIKFGHPLNRDGLLQSFMFPNSLKKLTLECRQLEWNDMAIIGSLPRLEALKLRYLISGMNWDPVEGDFLRLKYLQIYFCDLICWNADKAHFPLLENLVLVGCIQLEEIPSGIGDIPTLERICLVDCSISATLSAIKILEEQESMGNEGLQVRVNFERKQDLVEFMEQVNLEGLTGIKFQIKGA